MVCIHHFYFDDTRFFHATDLSSRYSTAVVVPNSSLSSAATAFEASWMSQFWCSGYVLGDNASNKYEFLTYLSQKKNCIQAHAQAVT